MASLRTIADRGYTAPVGWVILVAVVCVFVAGLFNPYAGIAAGIAGGLLWWGLIERPAKPTLLRGGLFGFLTVLLAHPLMWIIGGVFGHPIFSAILNQTGGSINSLSDLTTVLTSALLGSFFSLVFISFTIPLGVTLGVGLVFLRQRIH